MPRGIVRERTSGVGRRRSVGLIEGPDCRTLVSTQALICPRCGCPLPYIERIRRPIIRAIAPIGPGCALLVGSGLLWLAAQIWLLLDFSASWILWGPFVVLGFPLVFWGLLKVVAALRCLL